MGGEKQDELKLRVDLRNGGWNRPSGGYKRPYEDLEGLVGPIELRQTKNTCFTWWRKARRSFSVSENSVRVLGSGTPPPNFCESTPPLPGFEFIGVQPSELYQRFSRPIYSGLHSEYSFFLIFYLYTVCNSSWWADMAGSIEKMLFTSKIVK